MSCKFSWNLTISKTKAVLFDFGGTLDSNGVRWLERIHPIYHEHGVKAPPEEFARAFHHSDDTLASRHNLKGLNLEETLRLQVAGVLERLTPDRIELGSVIAGAFVRAVRGHIASIRPVLSSLRSRYALGIVSNFYGNLESVLEGEGLRDLFGAVSDSGVVGVTKPEPGLFLDALGRLGASPGEAIMVGDSLERDMRGAEGLGMRHAWLYGDRWKNGGPAAPCCEKGWVLRELKDLEGRL